MGATRQLTRGRLPVTDDGAIRDLLARYALALDTDDIDRCLDLFTDDGEFVVFGRNSTGATKSAPCSNPRRAACI